MIRPILLLFLLPLPALAQDWPHWGRDASRNMVAPHATNLPIAKTVKWSTRLGSTTYGNPTVATGRVFVGTNNDPGHDPRFQGDYGVLLCLDEATGKFLWQLAIPKLAAGKNVDAEQTGLCSSAAVDGDRLYIVTNRCEVLCLDVRGQANGNDGPFTDESRYLAGPGNPPVPLAPTDADILWRYDLRDELGVFPHQMTSSSVLVVGDRLYVTTSNGRDWTERHIPAPNAPALIGLDKRTGQLLARETSGISQRTFLCNWSSPALAGNTILFGADDGFCYGFDKDLKELRRTDCNPPHYRVRDGKPTQYDNTKGPSGILATPVVADGKVYIALGRQPEKDDAPGALNCLDAATGKLLWRSEKVGRSLSTVAVSAGLVYAADYAGTLYALDAASGDVLWDHDTEGHIWGSPLVADGKVHIGSESRTLTILAASHEKKLLAQIPFDNPIYSSPIVASNILYVATERHLFALENKQGAK